jgi:hypothetical protein
VQLYPKHGGVPADLASAQARLISAGHQMYLDRQSLVRSIVGAGVAGCETPGDAFSDDAAETHLGHR